MVAQGDEMVPGCSGLLPSGLVGLGGQTRREEAENVHRVDPQREK